MADSVQDVIDALKRHLGTNSDQDLARRLSLGRSTISSWKARGAVPSRYRRILEGDEPTFALEPKEMTEEEGLALSLAIMRLMKSHGDVVNDQRRFIAHGSSLWNLLFREYHRALEEFTTRGERDLNLEFHNWTNKFNVLAFDEFFGSSE